MFRTLSSKAALAALAISIIALAGCSADHWGTVSTAAGKSFPAPPAPSFPAAPAAPSAAAGFVVNTPYYDASAPTNAADEAASSADQDTSRKIVRTGSSSLEVADIQKAQDNITALAVQLNGYVVSSNRYNVDENTQGGSISIRVPADKFDEAMLKLRTLAVKVDNESSDSQDVTEQYSDLQLQLKNQEAAESQYLEILKKADNVSDILAVQKELTDVRANIESLKGRILYLDRTSDMSLIQVTLIQYKPIGQNAWDVPGVFKSAVDGLVAFGQGVLSVLIWVLVFAPVWVVLGVIAWLIVRAVRKSRKA